MNFLCQSAPLRGDVVIPGSKSHTIRAVMIAGMATGESVIEAPLVSADALSAAHGVTCLGATVDKQSGVWRVKGNGGDLRVWPPLIDTGNSGTSTNILLGLCSLLKRGQVTLTGDEQIQRRPCAQLAKSLQELGARLECVRGNGCPPYRVCGGLYGGGTTLEAKSSQYLTSLLLACPLAPADSHITVPVLFEKPYVQMTLDWLAAQGIRLEQNGLQEFQVRGGQQYRAFSKRIPADFSSATFFLCAGALGSNAVTCVGMDMNDSQGDKAVVDYLKAMGADVTVAGDRVTVRGRGLTGVELDLDATPDALPMMAVTACFAKGKTVLRNVAHARIKETDRIKVMAVELGKLGAKVEELPDGLVIHESRLRGAAVEGYGDHRVVMSMAVAASAIPGETRISTAEAAGVTFPEFADLMRGLGARITATEN